jgi:NAD+ synthase
MKIFVCQTAPKVGALEANLEIVQENYMEAISKNANICVFPELCISGYLAEDLFFKNDFITKIEAISAKLIASTKDTCLLLPTLIRENNRLYNVVLAAQNGKLIGKTYKNELANHGVFDEKRYFTAGKPMVISINNIKVGVPICEDIWYSQICIDLENQGAQIFIIPNASPYEKDKLANRIKLVESRFKDTKAPLIYCNQALSHDGIVFDGKSFIYDGKLTIIGKGFATDTGIVEYSDHQLVASNSYKKEQNLYAEIYSAAISGVRDYVHDNGFQQVLIGLSGGIDSAIVCAIAVQALGKENVLCYMLPSKFTSKESVQDATKLAANLGVFLDSISIQKIVDELALSLGLETWDQSSITYQNLQSRARGTLLMGLANKTNTLLLTTGNKSEYATGYATIYGDMNGAFNPIKDLYKTEIFKLAEYINSKNKIIPKNIIEKEPSAELAPNQKDIDSLPDYTILDKILNQLIENRASLETLYNEFDQKTVDKVIKLFNISEFKRYQSAPGVKISSMHFGKDRRFPITNFYN